MSKRLNIKCFRDTKHETYAVKPRLLGPQQQNEYSDDQDRVIVCDQVIGYDRVIACDPPLIIRDRFDPHYL
jgi:hypothetical protein